MSTTTYLQESFGRNLEVPMESPNTRHSFTLSTIHANSAQQDLARFTSCVLQSGADLPFRAIKTNLADSLIRSDDPEVVIQRIADYRAEYKADPCYYARHMMKKAQPPLERERGNRGPTEDPDSRLVSEK